MNYDLLVQIASHLSLPLLPDNNPTIPPDPKTITQAYKTLHALSLTSRVCSTAAAKVLYRHVVVSPKGDAENVLDLKRMRQRDVLPGQFKSAMLPHNAPFVLSLSVTGHLSTRPAPPSTDFTPNFPTSLALAIDSWPNLQSVRFTPETLHEETFSPALSSLSLRNLRHLHITSRISIHSDVLAAVKGLESLAIDNPNRTYREVLPGWVEKLAGTLRGLHLQSDCGSITPGVLTLLKPHVRHLRAFTLGLSYSITNDDLFAFLECMPELEELDVRYYLQNKPPPSVPPTFLTNLKSLTLRYAPGDVDTPTSITQLRSWLSSLLSHSHSHSHTLESVRILRAKGYSGERCQLGNVLRDLSKNEQLKDVVIPRGFVDVEAVKELSERCGGLEEMWVDTESRVLLQIPEIVASCPHIHTLVFRLTGRFTGGPRNLDALSFVQSSMEDVVRTRKGRLRRVVVNNYAFEGSWVSSTGNKDGKLEYVVERREVEGDEWVVELDDDDDLYDSEEDY
ncbi:hypothetical protein BC629DRAFT_1511447 [Irpex lacteus]|nr:hypothetical protein BC629DRAFT_1511447 [Irpex lacteus]